MFKHKPMPLSYSDIAKELKIPPEELNKKIDYFKERDRLLTKHAHALKEHVNELKRHIELRQSIEKDLQQAKEHAELIHKVTPTAIFTVNKDKMITLWNLKAEELTGYASSEIVGKTCSFLSKSLESPNWCIFSQGESDTVNSHELEITIKNGEKRTILKNAVLLTDANNASMCAIESFVDITERKKNETELLRLSRAVNQSPSIIIISDLDGYIVYGNERFTSRTGYAFEMIKKNKLTIFSPEIIASEVYEKIKDAFKNGSEWKGEFSITNKDGSSYWELASISPIRNQEGDIINFLILKEDITQRKKHEEELCEAKNKLEIQTWGLTKTNNLIKILYCELAQKNEELLKLDQMKSDFISTVSHELRTPLTVIREGVSQMNDGILGQTSSEQREFLSIVLSHIDRLGRMINDLLDMSKIESGNSILRKKPFNIVDCAHEIVVAFQVKVTEKNLTIIERYSHQEITVNADKDKITQVFTNLLSNALKFTLRGTVEISIRELSHYVECSVMDTGIGVEQDQLPKLFNKFQQFGRIDGAGEKGTGLGLSIVKGIIELHNGNIWALSTIGKGTRFTFTLPKNIPNEKTS